MRKLMKMVTILPILLILSACGISAGTVSDKVIEPQRNYTTQQCTFIGKVMTCHPIYHNDDTDYCFTLTNDDQDTNYICTNKDDWDTINEGDYYDADAE